MDYPQEINDSFYDVDADWLAEVKQRATASDSGDTNTIPFEEAWKRITAKILKDSDR